MAVETSDEGRPEGVRALKRRETLARIAQAGLKLFVEHGYEQTTLDAIAAAAGISRRTFFYYFKSKEDVLLAYEGGGGFADALRAAILEYSRDEPPLRVARNCLMELASKYETKESITADRLLRSTEALRLRKEALFLQIESVLVEAFFERWPGAARREGLRVVAMVVMGTLRLAMERWREEGGKTALSLHIKRGFELLSRHICT